MISPFAVLAGLSELLRLLPIVSALLLRERSRIVFLLKIFWLAVIPVDLAAMEVILLLLGTGSLLLV